jgi:hypothetical protein
MIVSTLPALIATNLANSQTVIMFSTSLWPYLDDLLQSYMWVLDSISSLNCVLSLVTISAGFTYLLVRNLTTMCFATAE